MQNDRQIGIARYRKLCLEQGLLRRPVQPAHKIIQADLADGNDRMLLEQTLQRIDIAGRMLLHKDGMQAERRKQSSVTAAQRQQCPPVCRANAGDDDTGHSQFTRTLQHRLPVVIKIRNVDVAMAVNQLHGMDCMRMTRANTAVIFLQFWYVSSMHSHGDIQDDPVDSERRFGGIVRLYGQQALERFAEAHVCVLGIGGVGSWAAEALARSGIGHITLVDLDHVAESNINRQGHALDSTLGKAKVSVMAGRIRDINPQCAVTEVEEFLTVENLETLLARPFDYIIDCIDGFRTKARLIAWCRSNKRRVITVGGAGGQTDPTMIRVADLSRTEHDALFSKTRKLLRQNYGFPENLKRRFDIPCVYSLEQPMFPAGNGSISPQKPAADSVGGLTCAGGLGSSVTVTSTFGMVAAAHVLKKLSAGS